MSELDINARIKQAYDLISSTVPDEERAQLPLDHAVIGDIKRRSLQGFDARQQLLDSFANQNDAVSKRKAEVLQNIAQGGQLSKSETAAMLMIGMLPILIGGAIKGKKGIGIGAQAGALGTQVAAAGFKDDERRTQTAALQQLNDLSGMQSDIRQDVTKTMLAEADATDKSKESALDRQSRETAASIRAGGDVAAGKAIGQQLGNVAKALDVEGKLEEKASSGRAFQTEDGEIAIPNGRVDDKLAADARETSALYRKLVTSIKTIQELNASSDVPGAARVAGKLSDRMEKERTIALQTIKKLEKVPGAMGDASLSTLSDVLKSPTSLMANLKAALPGTATIDEQLENTRQLMQRQQKEALEGANYTLIKPGTKAFHSGLKKPVIFLGVTPDGQIQYQIDDSAGVP